MRRLWLLFAQGVTLTVAVIFAIQTLKPHWLPRFSGFSPSPRPVAVTPTSPASLPTRSTVQNSYALAVQHSMPSVVYVQSTKVLPKRPNTFDDPFLRRFFGDGQGADTGARSMGLGSGVVVSQDGYVLTNNHVVEGADEIEVTLNDGRKFPGQIVGKDPETDLAVLRLTDAQNLPVMAFADQSALQVGDVVLAIGNPFGVGQTVTMGIVSALGRNHLGINTFENFIQTDAAINPGNSGGALVNTEGQLVGINTAIYSNSGGSLGIGFAIPVSLARTVLEQITATGEVTRGWVGVEIQELTQDLAESFGLKSAQGALISGVIRGGPADKAGIRPGDILVAIDDKPIVDGRTMLDVIAALPPATRAQFALRRQTQTVTLPVEVGKRPAPSVSPRRR